MGFRVDVPRVIAAAEGSPALPRQPPQQHPPSQPRQTPRRPQPQRLLQQPQTPRARPLEQLRQTHPQPLVRRSHQALPLEQQRQSRRATPQPPELRRENRVRVVHWEMHALLSAVFGHLGATRSCGGYTTSAALPLQAVLVRQGAQDPQLAPGSHAGANPRSGGATCGLSSPKCAEPPSGRCSSGRSSESEPPCCCGRRRSCPEPPRCCWCGRRSSEATESPSSRCSCSCGCGTEPKPPWCRRRRRSCPERSESPRCRCGRGCRAEGEGHASHAPRFMDFVF